MVNIKVWYLKTRDQQHKTNEKNRGKDIIREYTEREIKKHKIYSILIIKRKDNNDIPFFVYQIGKEQTIW